MPSNKLFDLFRLVPDPRIVNTQVDEFVFPLRLPSAIEGSSYDAVFTARWTSDPQGPPADRAELRRQAFYRSTPVTTRRSVHEVDLTGPELNAHLLRAQWTEMTNIFRPAVTVQLSASPEARRTAGEWEALRSQLAVERMRNELEIEQLRHLREDIFKQPAVARTYWLKHHPEATAEVLGDHFERIAEKLGAAPEKSTMVIANLLHDFLAKLTPEHEQYLIAQLHQVFRSYGRDDLADGLFPGRTVNGASPGGAPQ